MSLGRMRSRWFHPPLLHSPALGLEKRATWLELFYDLIFVAAFIQLGNGLASRVSVSGFAAFAAMFVPLWVAWTGFTFFQNRYTLDDFTHRLTVFLQMFAIGGMAISAPLVLNGETVAFSLSAGAAQLIVGVMHFRAWRQEPESRDYARYWGLVFSIGGATWLIASLVPPPESYALWGVATLVVLAAPLHKVSRALADRFPIDFEHLGERFALLTLIVLGESFVKVLGSVADERAGFGVYASATVLLVITCGIWWVYFDDVAGTEIRKGPGQWIIWLYAHLPLQVGVTAAGVSLKKAIHFGWDEPAAEGYRWLLAGSLALVYSSVAAIDAVTERRQAELSDRARVNARWTSALLLLVLAPAGRAMSGNLLLSIVTLIAIAHVVFDMMMAPFEESAHAELGTRTSGEAARARASGEAPPLKRRPDPVEAVRKDTPSELRRDLYFYFIEGSWLRVFVALSFLFVVSNVLFAGMYLLEPESIQNAGANSFSDAFFFSVQTMSTVGYGAMIPKTAYANVVMTVEAALSLIGVAVLTGLVFAKVSRPKSSVLFSRPMVLTTMGGKRVLMCRAGNARGNEVVDASMALTALMDEISPEGHHLRRLHDLKLVRQRSPMFILSWSVMHEIDEESPLKDVDWSNPTRLVSIVATLMGHDGTYGQTTYARHLYAPEDVRVGERFVDVIHELPDGRLMLDYKLFHETRPDEPVAKAG